ncbi:multinuclear nonheme iron-dependent oxidase [Pontibacter toksunensis]|uniref:multinuclear nonheme iron-dependent oxidase n=1 Tax=Pontibacter toksunensis TaxID=1332631 RepID=UPI00366EB57F
MKEEPEILASIACNLDADILSAAFPLLEEGRVEAIEWSFDTLYWTAQVPYWFTEMLLAYSQQKRLIGHGVYFSLLSGKWTKEQQHWLEQLKQLSSQYSFDHITEHFGFFTGQNFHSGAPLHVPYTSTTLRIGQDRLSRIYDACECPVGLENLAFSYALDEVKQHGEFLEKLVEPVNGFLILDLHNLYCQLHNFSISYDGLIALYPLHRVREIHISGGSWEESALVPAKKIRRDTHDGAVPEEVFQLLELTLPKCPNLKYVVLEQLGSGLKNESSRARFRQDFMKMEALVQKSRGSLHRQGENQFLPLQSLQPGSVIEDDLLHGQQLQLSHILETASSYEEACNLLRSSSLAESVWKVEKWEPHMLETAMSIAQKWKRQG